MKSSGSRLTRSSRKRIACSLPSTLAASDGTGRAAGTVVDDEFDGADERPLPQPALDSAARQRDKERERRRGGETEGRRDSVSAPFCLSVSLSLRLPILLLPDRHLVLVARVVIHSAV